MKKELIQEAIKEATREEANLVIWDRRDTFTIENGDVKEIEVENDHLRVPMQEGKATVFVEYDAIYKLVVERERAGRGRTGSRAGFGATG
jgi:sporulation-control protein spo0M